MIGCNGDCGALGSCVPFKLLLAPKKDMRQATEHRSTKERRTQELIRGSF